MVLEAHKGYLREWCPMVSSPKFKPLPPINKTNLSPMGLLFIITCVFLFSIDPISSFMDPSNGGSSSMNGGGKQNSVCFLREMYQTGGQFVQTIQLFLMFYAVYIHSMLLPESCLSVSYCLISSCYINCILFGSCFMQCSKCLSNSRVGVEVGPKSFVVNCSSNGFCKAAWKQTHGKQQAQYLYVYMSVSMCQQYLHAQ